jgi:pheromone shutdown protein TraB
MTDDEVVAQCESVRKAVNEVAPETIAHELAREREKLMRRAYQQIIENTHSNEPPKLPH